MEFPAVLGVFLIGVFVSLVFCLAGNALGLSIVFCLCSKVLRVRKVRTILGVFEVFLAIFKKTKENKGRDNIPNHPHVLCWAIFLAEGFRGIAEPGAYNALF